MSENEYNYIRKCLVDSGVSAYMWNDETMFSEFKKSKTDRAVSIGDGSDLVIMGEGIVQAKNVLDVKNRYFSQILTVRLKTIMKPHICELLQ